MRAPYTENAGAVFSLKYRRPVLTPPVDQRLKEVLAETAVAHGMSFHAVEVIPAHVHLFVEVDPTM